MAELVTFKIEPEFLREVDRTVEHSYYQNRTEFIRSALRRLLYEERLKSLIGSAKSLSPKERKARTKELAGKDASYILRKYGLD